MRSCLDKLDFWTSSTQPFTKYIKVQSSYAHNAAYTLTSEVENVIKNSKHGLLVIGAIYREDEMWAALLLAQKLSWPVVADILSGLRLRKILSSYREYEKSIVFIDHFDHVLLCDAARQWAELDVILQVMLLFACRMSFVFGIRFVTFMCWRERQLSVSLISLPLLGFRV